MRLKVLLCGLLVALARAVEIDVEQLEENEEAQQDRDEPTADVVSQIVEQADDVDLQRCAPNHLTVSDRQPALPSSADRGSLFRAPR
jgi:hypothetical protein